MQQVNNILLIALMGYLLIQLVAMVASYMQLVYRINNKATDLLAKNLTAQNCIPISVVIYSEREDLQQLHKRIEYVEELDYPDWEIIVIDNSGNDIQIKGLVNKYKLKYIQSVKYANNPDGAIYQIYGIGNMKVIKANHVGKAAALNAAVKESRFPLMSILGDGVAPDKNSLKRLALKFMLDDTICVTYGYVRLGTKDGDKLSIGSSKSLAYAHVMNGIRTSAMLGVVGNTFEYKVIKDGVYCVIKKSVLTEVGGFEETEEDTILDMMFKLSDNKASFELDASGYNLNEYGNKGILELQTTFNVYIMSLESKYKGKGIHAENKLGHLWGIAQSISNQITTWAILVIMIAIVVTSRLGGLGTECILTALVGYVVLSFGINVAALAFEKNIRGITYDSDAFHLIALMALTEYLWYRQIETFFKVFSTIMWRRLGRGKRNLTENEDS